MTRKVFMIVIAALTRALVGLFSSERVQAQKSSYQSTHVLRIRSEDPTWAWKVVIDGKDVWWYYTVPKGTPLEMPQGVSGITNHYIPPGGRSRKGEPPRKDQIIDGFGTVITVPGR